VHITLKDDVWDMAFELFWVPSISFWIFREEDEVKEWATALTRALINSDCRVQEITLASEAANKAHQFLEELRDLIGKVQTMRLTSEGQQLLMKTETLADLIENERRLCNAKV
jgi:hypothetical protein